MVPCRGSSPLARGLRGGVDGVHLWFRIIPARAGFTRPPPWGGRADRDHSRSRGVYLRGRPDGRGRPGSSPLARGLLQTPRTSHPAGGIIPARAGFTPTGVSCSIRTWDHPRSRGVYSGDWVVTTPSGGSSPLARGLRSAGDGGDGVAGIIPARAGFTQVRHVHRGGGADHPRSRGVYGALRRTCARGMGSSPLARGLHETGDPSEPATVGSSPLARGLQTTVYAQDGTTGIIPARAGFTVCRG